jgi:hypothetical protein
LIDFVNPLPPAPDGGTEDASLVDAAEARIDLGADASPKFDEGAKHDAGAPTMAGGCQCDLAADSGGRPALIVLVFLAAWILRRSGSAGVGS